MLEHKFIHNLNKYLSAGHAPAVLLAISGGPDSVCLLDLLARYREKHGLTLYAAHYNHQLRGTDSDDDEQFVTGLCRSYDVPLSVGRADVGAFAREQKLSIEEAARLKRYGFFAQLAHKLSVTTIVTGHHSDDQAETILFRFFHGARIDVLAGMDIISSLFCDHSLHLFRPLLSVWKKEIDAYITAKHLHWRIDLSNADPRFPRNKLRNEIIPAIEQGINPAIKQSVLNVSSMIREDMDFISQAVNQFKPAVAYEGDRLTIGISSLPAHPALRKRVLMNIFKEHLPPESVTFPSLTKLEQLLANGKASFSIQLKHNLILNKYGEVLEVVPASKQATSFSYILEQPGSLLLEPLGSVLHCTLLTEKPSVMKSNNPVYLDADKVKFPLTIRPRKPGDGFYPLGVPHSKKLKDFFIDKKINRFIRDHIPLVVDATGNIIWVVNYQIDDRYKITAETVHVLTLYIRQLSNSPSVLNEKNL